jgi:hypothetical protein
VDYETSSPAVAAAFDNNWRPRCTVLTCSCTSPFFYWPSTTNASNLATDPPGSVLAWAVFFNDGSVVAVMRASTSSSSAPCGAAASIDHLTM